jgi:hypothetical protein
MFKTVMAAISKGRDKIGTPHPLSRVSLDSGLRGGVANDRQGSVTTHTFPLTEPGAKCSGQCHSPAPPVIL